MHVIIQKRSDFTTIDLKEVKNIAFANGTYTITKSDNTTITYTATDYLVCTLIA